MSRLRGRSAYTPFRSRRQKFSYPLPRGRFMENKTLREQERALLLKLREAVNSQEEFDYVEAELARLNPEEATAGSSGHPISTVADAVRFLEARCHYLAVQVEIVPPLWEVISRQEVFAGTYTATEVIQLARGKYARLAVPAAGSWPRCSSGLRSAGGAP